MKALIAEDNPVSGKYFKKILSAFGECDIASDGNEAIHYFTAALEQKDPYDLICLDIIMPEMDGHAALKEIRQAEEKAGLERSEEAKVIMLTGVEDAKSVLESYKEGATAYLVKPVKKDQLIEEIRSFGLI